MSFAKSIFVPSYSPRNKRMSIRVFLGLFSLTFLLTVVFSLLIGEFVPNATLADHGVRMGLYKNLLYFVLFVPLLEESGFRMWLKRGRFSFAFSVIAVAVNLLMTVLFSHQFSYIVIIRMLILVFLFLIIIKSQYQPDMLINHYAFFYYFSILAFGYMHLCKYTDVHLINPLLMPILVLPYICSGLILAHTRVTYGFFYGVLLHAFLNLIPISLIAILL